MIHKIYKGKAYMDRQDIEGETFIQTGKTLKLSYLLIKLSKASLTVFAKNELFEMILTLNFKFITHIFSL